MESKSTKRDFAKPELHVLGSVKELTEVSIDKCTGSADLTLPRNPPQGDDFTCGPF